MLFRVKNTRSRINFFYRVKRPFVRHRKILLSDSIIIVSLKIEVFLNSHFCSLLSKYLTNNYNSQELNIISNSRGI